MEMKTKICIALGIFLGAFLFVNMPVSALAVQVQQAPIPGQNERGGGVLGNDWKKVTEKKGVIIKPPEGASPVEAIRFVFFERILPQFKYIFAFVAILVWAVYLLIMVNNAGSESIITEQKKNLLWGVAGFIVISLAVELGNVFAPTRGNAQIIDQPGAQFVLQKVISYIQLLLTPLAIGAIFYAGFLFITSHGNDEQIKKARISFLWGFFGVTIAMVAEPFINTVFYPGPDAHVGQAEQQNFAKQLTDFLRFALTFLGVLAMASFVIAGAYYVTSFGDDGRQKKAKTIIGASILGIIIILSAYALVSALTPTP